jgi:uncharacterized protein (DUF1697 family)
MRGAGATRVSPKPRLTRYVAWLRAVNVGGHVIKMDRLRAEFESLGLKNVETFIASGNVIFDAQGKTATDLERTIEARLQTAFGYPVVTFLRSAAEVVAIAEYSRFAQAEVDKGASLYVAFLRSEPDRAASRKVQALENDLDAFKVHRREVYWLRRNVAARRGEPGPPLERILGAPATTRNITTIRRVVLKYCSTVLEP